MSFFLPSLVFECGATHVSVVTVASRHRTPRFERVERIDFPLVDSFDDWLAAVSRSIATLRTRRIRGVRALLILPGHLCLAKMVRLPRVAATKRDQLLRFEAEQAFPLPLADVVWSQLEVFSEDDDAQLLLCAARAQVVAELCSAFAAHGYAITRIVPSCVALLKSLEHDSCGPGLFVDCGARSTTFIFHDRGRRVVRSCVLGYRDLLDFVRRTAEPATLNPELLLRENEVVRQLAAEWLAVRLTHEARRTLTAGDRPPALAPPQSIALAGGVALVPGFIQQLQCRWEIPVALHRASLPPSADDASNSATPTLIGGALFLDRGVNDVRWTMDLLPSHLAAQRKREQRWQRFTMAAVIACGIMLLFLTRSFQQGSFLEQQVTELETVLAPTREFDAQTRSAHARLAELRAEISELHAASEGRDAWVRFLADLETCFQSIDGAFLREFQELHEPPAAERANVRRFACRAYLPPRRPEDSSPEDLHDDGIELLQLIERSSFVERVGQPRFSVSAEGGLAIEFIISIAVAKLP